jgi:hypothetical protein
VILNNGLIRAALSRIAEPQRSAFALRHYYGWADRLASIKEMANSRATTESGKYQRQRRTNIASFFRSFSKLWGRMTQLHD